jgi:uncharacterized protein
MADKMINRTIHKRIIHKIIKFGMGSLLGWCCWAYAAPLRIALLLPSNSESLAQAAHAVQAGVMAAHERDGEGCVIEVIETADSVAEILGAYQMASNQFDLIIGPMTRSAVSAIAQGGEIDKPTVVLGAIETGVAPTQMLAIGLSLEDEARQLAQWAAKDKSHNKLMILGTQTAWQRRAAKAFANHWPLRDATVLELTASGGYLTAASLKQLRTQLQTVKPNVLFLALDARQAAQVRTLLPADTLLYGSSQMNADIKPEQEPDPLVLLEGVRFLELPWQVQPDHAAVMVYPKLLNEMPNRVDHERLYALGIDAFRIAREIGVNHQTQFKLDGVTGVLTVQFNNGPPRFERKMLPAVFRSGVLQVLPQTPPTQKVP